MLRLCVLPIWDSTRFCTPLVRAKKFILAIEAIRRQKEWVVAKKSVLRWIVSWRFQVEPIHGKKGFNYTYREKCIHINGIFLNKYAERLTFLALKTSNVVRPKNPKKNEILPSLSS